MQKSDNQLKQNLEEELKWDNRLESSNIEVEVKDSQATIRGTVPSYRALIVAENDAWLVNGIQNVNNNLKVAFPKDYKTPTDDELESRIENQFRWDYDLMTYKLDAQVNLGELELTGTVDALWKKYWAEELASNVTGVISIENEIAIVPSEDLIDEDIAQNITDALTRRFEVNVNNVDVEVDAGEVTLMGEVKNWAEWKAVTDVVHNTLGVVSVKDNLTISV